LVLGELPVKKGTIFMVDSMANHYISQYFEHPHQFDPERWLPREGKTFAPQPYTHLTFSAGPRSCIGKQLAQLEMKVAMVKVFRSFDLHLSTTDLQMNFDGFLYQPQALTTTFTARTHQ
jgi:cytochrome P450